MILAALIALIAVNAAGVFFLAYILNDLNNFRTATHSRLETLEIVVKAINQHVLDVGAEIRKKRDEGK